MGPKLPGALIGQILIIVVALLLPTTHAAADAASHSKISSSLALLMSLHQKHPDRVPPDALTFSDAAGVRAVLHCNRKPKKDDLDELQRLGAQVSDRELPLPRGLIKGCRIPWRALPALKHLPFIDSIESVWQPGVLPTLDLSADVIGAPDVWRVTEQESGAPDPPRVVVADFDIGVDVFHPSLWYADGSEYSWIDVDGNLALSPGVDAVDLNRNGAADPGEALSFFKAPVKDNKGVVTNDSGPFAAGLDWLYNDANGNGTRDYGPSFGESTATYGEQVFVCRDTNGDATLSPGEALVALHSPKIAALLGQGGATFTRGENLIQADPDTASHGTAVCGILSSRHPGLGKYVGISPSVDTVMADRSRNDFTQYIAWAEGQGAKVMIYEFGAWIFQFLDGTSPLEQAITAEWGKGIVQIVPAGNLANGKKHAAVKTNNGSAAFDFTVPGGRGINTVYLTVLWRAPVDAVAFILTNPAGAQTALPGDQMFYCDPSGNFCWSYGVQQSQKGTRRFDIFISGVTVGSWRLAAEGIGEKQVALDGYISDNIGGWSGGVYFSSHLKTSGTVTWPATADKALVVGSFSTRGIGVAAGDISAFSGQGPRIDGAQIVDVCAPGNYDIFSPCSKDAGNAFGSYKAFSGTSAAAPHVASACALLLRIDPSLSPDRISNLITCAARSDTYTSTTPNEAWGYGKLDIATAAMGALSDLPETTASAKARPDGDSVTLFGKLVVGAWNEEGYFYLEETNRSSGIKVLGSGVAEGDKVLVVGNMTTVGVERAIQAQTIDILQSSQILPKPLAMKNRAVGGPLVQSGGPDNTGILITIWGRVIETGLTSFVVDDGSGNGIHVPAVGFPAPAVGSFVKATGISSLTLNQQQIHRTLLPRRPSDVIVVQ